MDVIYALAAIGFFASMAALVLWFDKVRSAA